MKKVMLVFGTRPEAIKMAPLIIELKKDKYFDVVVCTTGQHKQMLEQVLNAFNIKQDYDLDIMKQNQTLYDITTAILLKLKDVVTLEKPDIILVHGDTQSSFVASLVAYYEKIKLGHVEAGLRTFDKYAPYPEEFNRQAISILSDFDFAPTQMAFDNLLLQKKSKDNIYVVGNTAIDALKYTYKKDYTHKILDWAKGYKLIFLTAHRRENLGKPLEDIFNAIKKILEENNNFKLVYPMHSNPKVRNVAKQVFENVENVMLCEPLDVFDCHNIIARSYLVLTDSGGLQEETPSFDVPVLVLRDTTERPEGLNANTLKLVGTNFNSVYNGLNSLIHDDNEYKNMQSAKNPYGDGNASKYIVQILKEKL